MLYNIYALSIACVYELHEAVIRSSSRWVPTAVFIFIFSILKLSSSVFATTPEMFNITGNGNKVFK